MYVIIILIGLSHPLRAQTSEQSSGRGAAFQVSFVPGVSNTDSYSTSQFSLNILGGYNGAFNGIELGTVFNGNRYDVSGLQLSGAVNWNEQQSSGAIFSGAVNVTETFGGGVLSSGGINISRQETRGVLLAGSLNITGDFSKGLMAAGGMNLADNASGFLMTGGVNIVTGKAGGISIAPFNIAGEHAGLQLGVLNIAGGQEGTQIGVINVAGKGEGTPIGLLSFVENGRFNVDLWGSETGFVNGGVRIGTETIYNVISIGYNPVHGDDLWQVGIGIGYHKELGNKGDGFETDLMSYQVNHDGGWTTENSNHFQWRFHYTKSFSEGAGIFTGPSLNMYLADENLSDSHIPYTFKEHSSGSDRLYWWAGWTFGIELF